MNPLIPRLTFSCLALLMLGACVQGQPAAIASAQAAPASPSAAATLPLSPTSGLPAMLVHKQESCGCCGAWVEHMREAGFAVEVRNVEDMEPVKSRLGIPYGMGSCHTAEVAGYFVEGHVPADDIKRLLAERPQAKGLALPGMPVGSPGMEHPDGVKQPFKVALIGTDGQAQVFSEHHQP